MFFLFLLFFFNIFFISVIFLLNVLRFFFIVFIVLKLWWVCDIILIFVKFLMRFWFFEYSLLIFIILFLIIWIVFWLLVRLFMLDCVSLSCLCSLECSWLLMLFFLWENLSFRVGILLRFLGCCRSFESLGMSVLFIVVVWFGCYGFCDGIVWYVLDYVVFEGVVCVVGVLFEFC